jgi:hypothetical protein
MRSWLRAPLCGAINFADRVVRRVNVGEQFGNVELLAVIVNDGGAGNVRRAGGCADVFNPAGAAVRCFLLYIFVVFAGLAKTLSTSIF